MAAVLDRCFKGSFRLLSYLLHRLLHYESRHVRQALVAATVPERQLLVIQPEQVEDRGVEVVHADLLVDRLQSELVRSADDSPALRAAAREPHRVAQRVVVAALPALAVR